MKIVPLKCKKAVSKSVLEKYKNVQLINLDFVAGREHLEFALAHAEKAFQRGENISNNIFIEILLRASAQRQIKKALEIFGLNSSKEVVAICEELPAKFAEEYGCTECAEILDVDTKKYERIKKIFNIDEKEISAIAGKDFRQKAETLKEIVKERIALISVI